MALDDLIKTQESTVTDEDRIQWTRKMVERTFGVPADQLGAVELVDGNAVVQVEYNGSTHQLSWQRQSTGAIFWFVDGERVTLRESSRALTELRNFLAK